MASMEVDRAERRDDDPARQELGWYVRNCVRSPLGRQLEPVLLGQLEVLEGIAGSERDRDRRRLQARGVPSRQGGGRRHCLRELHQAIEDYASPPAGNCAPERNVLFARDEFGLDEIDTEILLLLVRYQRNHHLEALGDEVVRRLQCPARAVAALIGIAPREAERRLSPRGALVSSGIVGRDDAHGAYSGLNSYLQLVQPLFRALFRDCATQEEWSAAIFGPPLESALGWDDFAHLGAARDLAARLLGGARRDGVRGINILLHGPVGTGKTELCKVLAAQASRPIWAVGEADEAGGEPARGERLAALLLAQRLLAKRGHPLVLFDEAEDLLAQDRPYRLSDRRGRDESKVYLNRLMEQNPVPVLWTCNEVEAIDPAILRRMTFAIEVDTPSRPVRARIWRGIAAEAGVPLDDAAVERLAGRYEAPPAVAANAAQAVALAGGGEAEIETAVEGVLGLLGGGPRVADAGAHGFDLDLVNCREDLAALVEALARPGASRRWSLCIDGPPGTGKSMFARHLAHRLGVAFIQRRASDLLSMWVGDSEKRIAAAFAAARAEGAMLVFDEADSLLADRRGAVRSWEVTQVNEMLTWMESHPQPFVCTTNLMDRLDRASLRRFTLKLRFEPLTAHQAALAFERFFGLKAPPGLPEGLAPGDFATVARRRDLLGTGDAVRLCDWLRQEAEAKGARAAAMGFAVSRA